MKDKEELVFIRACLYKDIFPFEGDERDTTVECNARSWTVSWTRRKKRKNKSFLLVATGNTVGTIAKV